MASPDIIGEPERVGSHDGEHRARLVLAVYTRRAVAEIICRKP